MIKSISKPKFTTAQREYRKPEVDEAFLTDLNQFEETKMKKYERYLDSLEQQVEEKYDDPSEEYKYFIDQPLSKGDQIKADKGEQIQ